MSTQFDWQIGDDDEEPPEQQRRSWSLSSLATIALIALVAITLGMTWWAGRERALQAEQRLQQEVQDILNSQQEALLAGDGDLFFAFFIPDSSWRMSHLRPEYQAIVRAGLTVTRISTHGNEIWANVSWNEGSDSFQRVLFFRREGGRLLLAPSGSDYWQDRWRETYSWGVLRYEEIDEEWVADIAAFVEQTVAELCEQECRPARLPFTLSIAGDDARTAAEHEIRLPSPRLLALTETGEPAPLFWQQLHDELTDHLTPATIRFAIPPPRTGPCCHSLDFEGAAAEFMRQNPGIDVELVALDSLPGDLSTLATEVDGAAIPPTVDMVAAGAVYDLTDYAGSDPSFAVGDFHQRIWQGALWRERLWFVPLTAEFNLLYYDKDSFAYAGVPEPNLFWQWIDISESGPAVLAAQPEYSSMTWQFLDISRDPLFAYAYSLADSCPDTATRPCSRPLQPHHIAGALDWYKGLVQSEQMPDLARQSADERDWIMNNYQSAQRHALFWVDEPIRFEYYQLLDPIGIVPFPGVDSMEGVTPLWVDGAFISSHSERPRATWEWLKFLSYQPPVRSYRLVPARPSVTVETDYWRGLPRSLVDAMRTAYTLSRPVTLPDKRYFSWAQLAEMISEAQTPQETAQQPPSINWFGQKE